eukprot:TCALIF_11729-PA protein Name:"Protein of unknown function" AED:0.22 eAED:0.45 QI:3/0.5/0.33/1/0/0/3/0/141
MMIQNRSKKILWLVVLTICLNLSNGQRRRQNPNGVQERPTDNEFLTDRRNIGADFPYRRGDTPIFNFDVGDEPFLDSIPDLVKGLHQMAKEPAEWNSGAVVNSMIRRIAIIVGLTLMQWPMAMSQLTREDLIEMFRNDTVR